LIICVAIGISGKVLQFDMGDKRYPSGAVAFIQNNKPIGNMFNPYNWGGYLVWHLFPDYKVFIYGRTLNETAFLHCKQIFTAEQGLQPAAPLWERLLDVYGVNFIVTSAVSSAGTIYKLIDNLYASDQWKLVLADGKSMIFLRNIPDNRTLIKSYELPKEKIDDEIIGECKQGLEETPSTWGYYETLGYMYMKKNRLQEALMMFEKYLTMNPYNEKVIYYRDLIKEYIKKYN
jgi:tetratricopeptide (TPR) repeat protein